MRRSLDLKELRITMLLINFNEKDNWLKMIEKDFPSMSAPARFIANSNGSIVAKQIPFNRMIDLGLLVRKRGRYRLGFPNG